MDKTDFFNYLSSKYTVKSSRSRLYRAAKVEKTLGTDLNEITADDESMSLALQSINTGKKMDSELKNALKKYYEYKNGRSFLNSTYK